MTTSSSQLWAALQDILADGAWHTLQAIYGDVDRRLRWDGDDLRAEVGNAKQRAWQRNIRNVLGQQVKNGVVERASGARYRLPLADRAPDLPAPESPPASTERPVSHSVIVPAPNRKADGGIPVVAHSPRVIDYAAAEMRNRALGSAGEEWVVQVERARLTAAGRPDLAARVSWAARDRGDGLGYDVESFDVNGATLHIEVKTTRAGSATPILITAAELAFSQASATSYRLYRVYNFDIAPRIFILSGDVRPQLDLTPRVFCGVLRTT